MPKLNSNPSEWVIGIESKGLPELVELTAFASWLKAQYPDTSIRHCRDRLHSEIFAGHPALSGATRSPPSPISEELWSEMRASDARAQLFFSEAEEAQWKTWIQERRWNPSFPWILISPWCGKPQSPLHVFFWDRVVQKYSDEFEFWQLGWERDSAVQGCSFYSLPPIGVRGVRKQLFLLLQSQAILGVDNELSLCAEPLGRSGCLFNPTPSPTFSESEAMKQIDFFFSKLRETLRT